MGGLLMNFGLLALGFLGIAAPVVLLILYDRIRDERESRLLEAVGMELNQPHLRGLSAVKIKSWPPWADTVIVDLWNCSREQVWDVIEKLSNQLPSQVRLEVNGITDCRVRSTWKMTVVRTQSFVPYCPI